MDKKNIDTGYQIISSDETKINILKNITVFHLADDYSLIKRIHAKTANISKNK